MRPHHTLSGGARVSRILRSPNLRLLAAPPELKEEVIKRIDLRLKRVEEEVKAWEEYWKSKERGISPCKEGAPSPKSEEGGDGDA